MATSNNESSPYASTSGEVPRSRIPTLPSLTQADIKEAKERELIKQVVAKHKRTKAPIKREEED